MLNYIYKLNSKQQCTLGRKKTEKRSHQSANLVEQKSDSQGSDHEEIRLFTICTVQSNHTEEIMVRLRINGILVPMELDGICQSHLRANMVTTVTGGSLVTQ